MCFFFFFKQKTAYEMRISDWSSDVCSSDLLAEQAARGMGVLMITHDLMEAVRLADRILVMAAAPGRLVSHLWLYLPALQRRDAPTYQPTAEPLLLPAVRADRQHAAEGKSGAIGGNIWGCLRTKKKT